MAGVRKARGWGYMEDRYVVFPCDLPQWPRVQEEIEKLLQHSVGASNIAAVLDNLHHIAQGREGTDQRVIAVYRGLGQFLLKVDEDERRQFHQIVLPTILKRALQLSDLISNCDAVPLLLRQKAGRVKLPRQLVASIVACGFLCLFPTPTPEQKENFRSINFNNFFLHLSNEPQQAKLRCVLHYFERLADDLNGPSGNITITRKVLKEEDACDLDWWQKSDVPLCPLLVHTDGVIEDAPQPCIEVDFANKKIGGGVLAAGRVQEEIRFMTCPEFLATMVIVEVMDENESIWVEGFETYSAHTGYAKTLRYDGDFQDKNRVDSNGNKQSILCAIDALSRASQRQYQEILILREVNKAFIGFLQKPSDDDNSEADMVQSYSERLSEDILTTALYQAAMVLTQSRLQEHATPPSSGTDRLSHKDRSDSSDTSSDSLSHHPAPFGMVEGDRSWMMGMRRRSSNLSDVGSRRSSDLTSRRSSGSTRYSSDLSSDLEELYESFQPPQRPAAIKEEVGQAGASGLQDFVSSMVCNVMDEGSSLAVQMMPGVQNFDETQPADVAKPKAYRPPAPAPPSAQDLSFDFPLDLDSSSDSSNQTDDQKAKENIVRFVSQLVEKAFVGAGSNPADGEDIGHAMAAAPDMDHLHLHHSWSSSDSGSSPMYYHHLDVRPFNLPHDLHVPTAQYHTGHDRSRRLSHPLDPHPRYTPPVDVVQQRPSIRASSDYQRQSSHHEQGWSSLLDGSPRSSHMDVSPRMSQFDGSPRSEATAMWRHQEALLLNEVARMSGRRRSSADFVGSPPMADTSRQQVHTDSGMLRDSSFSGRSSLYSGFTDSLPHRDGWASARHGESLTDDIKEAVANSASAFHAVQVAAVPTPERPIIETRSTAFDQVRTNFHSKSDTSLLSTQQSYPGYDADRQAEYGPGASSSRYGGASSTASVAGQIVQASLETAVRTVTQQAQAVGGMAQWRSQQRLGGTHMTRSVNFGRSLSLSKPRRKGSMDECLSSFASSLARHGSLGELNSCRFQQRRGSSGFRDSTLSNFADQLLDSNNSVTDPAWLDLRRHSVGGERSGLFRRGSGESRASSLSRHSSTDILFPSCSTPDELPPWAMNPGRRSSREVVLDLLSTSHSVSTAPQPRRRQTTLTSHLDWFVQDLMMEAFNDALIELFGQDYLESVDYQRRQVRKSSRSRSTGDSEDQQLVDFADTFVQGVIQQAIDIVSKESDVKRRQRRAPSEEEEEGSNYEDALDVPFNMLENFATSLTHSVMDSAKVEVIRMQQRGPYTIATGNWGCGAFMGNPQMKALLQWAAASCAGAPAMHYYTFRSPEMERLPQVIESVRQRGWNVGHVLQYVVQYASQHRLANNDTLPSLYDMLLAK